MIDGRVKCSLHNVIYGYIAVPRRNWVNYMSELMRSASVVLRWCIKEGKALILKAKSVADKIAATL